jgi:hypothetical protein
MSVVKVRKRRFDGCPKSTCAMLSDNRDLRSSNGYLLALFFFGALAVAHAPITSAQQISYRLTITPAVPTDIDLLNAVVSTSVPVHVFYDEARVVGSAIQVFITTRPETVAPNPAHLFALGPFPPGPYTYELYVSECEVFSSRCDPYALRDQQQIVIVPSPAQHVPAFSRWTLIALLASILGAGGFALRR